MTNNPEEPTLKQNLQRLLDSNGLRASELADFTHIPASTIKYILSGNTYNPRVETLALMADYFKISIDEIYRGQTVNNNKEIKNNGHLPEVHVKRNNIPVLDWKDVKVWFSPHGASSDVKVTWLGVDKEISGNSFGLVIENEGRVIFPKNSIIIVEPQDTYQEDDLVIVSINKNIPTLRKVFDDGGSLFLRSVVAPFPPEPLDAPHLIWGKVIECRTRY